MSRNRGPTRFAAPPNAPDYSLEYREVLEDSAPLRTSLERWPKRAKHLQTHEKAGRNGAKSPVKSHETHGGRISRGASRATPPMRGAARWGTPRCARQTWRRLVGASYQPYISNMQHIYSSCVYINYTKHAYIQVYIHILSSRYLCSIYSINIGIYVY